MPADSLARTPPARRPAFTLVELLVVIVVIGILIAAVTIAGRGLSESNKRKVTENTMRLTTLAIEQFAQTDPLKLTYNTRGRLTFGSFPPYQLAYPASPDLTRPPYDVPRLVDGAEGVPGAVVGTFAQRLVRDLVGRPGDSLAQALNRISLDIDGALDARSDHATLLDDTRNGRHLNDMRALYVYLRVLAPGVLDQLPPQVFRSLSRSQATREFINTSRGPADEQNRTEILGIVDAWGVPLDYYLNVKVEFAGNLGGNPTYRITDRVPTLRSRGITPDEDAAERRDPLYASDRAPSDPDRWLFSTPFPSPRANSLDADAYGPTGSYSSAGYAFRWTGVLSIPGPEVNGWARALGVGDVSGKLAYVP